MKKYSLQVFILLSSFSVSAQNDAYLLEEYSEHFYPPVIPYQTEQQALSFSYAQSPYYLEITNEFQEKNSSAGKEIQRKVISNLAKVTSLYTSLNLPELWQSRETLLAFAPQISSFHVLVNGQQVAFVEKELPLQFNITPLLQEKDNLIELKFTDYSQNTVLHPVKLISVPPVHIIDFDLGQAYSPMPQKEIAWGENFQAKNYANPLFNLDYKTLSKFYNHSIHLEKTLENPNWDFKPIESGKKQHFGRGSSVGAFQTWNAELPNLYLYTQQITTSDKSITEVLSRKIGFRVIAMRNNKLSLGNLPLSKPLTLKPVLYHLPSAYDSLYNRTMLQEALTALKKRNINTIILSGYPTASPVYDLCDELGLYVIQKIDLPTLENMQKWTLDEKAEQWRKQKTKVIAGLHQLIKHPSAIAMYFTNEYSAVLNAKALVETFDSYYQNILVAFKDRILSHGTTHYQQLLHDEYKFPEWNKLTQKQQDSLQHAYQPVEFWIKTSSTDKLYLANKHDFIGLENGYLQWQVLENGRIIQEGLVKELPVLPGKSLEISLPFTFTDYREKQNCVFRFSLHLKASTLWADKDHELAWEEFSFTAADKKGVLTKSTK
jgi:beta-galactosidase/beta-glucuronidase